MRILNTISVIKELHHSIYQAFYIGFFLLRLFFEMQEPGHFVNMVVASVIPYGNAIRQVRSSNPLKSCPLHLNYSHESATPDPFRQEKEDSCTWCHFFEARIVSIRVGFLPLDLIVVAPSGDTADDG